MKPGRVAAAAAAAPAECSAGLASTGAGLRYGVFTLLLPYVDQKPLWDKYDTTVSWSDANNLPVTSERIPAYECASSPKHGGILDHNPDGYSTGSPWVGIVITVALLLLGRLSARRDARRR